MSDPNVDPPSDPAGGPGDAAPGAASEQRVSIDDAARGAAPQPAAPYGNLWVPLIVVPAGIVIAIVAVFALFGALASDEKSLGENLGLVVNGGKNERQQALFNLSRQATENQLARNEERALPFPIEEGFGEDVTRALAKLDEDDYLGRMVLAVLLTTLEDERGAEHLEALLALDDTADPDSRVRQGALVNLGLIRRQAAAPAMLAYLDHQDVLLRLTAAGALGLLAGPEVRAGLERALGDDELQVRATAALSLAKREPPDVAALPLLRDMAGKELWVAANAADRTQFRRGEDVSQFRVKAVLALARYGDSQHEFLRALSDDEDLHLRGSVLQVLEGKALR